jgi:hypothetical protein
VNSRPLLRAAVRLSGRERADREYYRGSRAWDRDAVRPEPQHSTG